MTTEQLAALRARMQHHVAKLEKFGVEGFHTPVTANEVLELLDRIEQLEAAPVPQGRLAELKRLAEICPELNMANYGPDDVDELNNWAVEIAQCAEALVSAPQTPAVAPVPMTPRNDVHEFRPHPKYPWFCAACGYAPHEPLMHGIRKA